MAGGQHEIGNHHSDAVAFGQLEPYRARDAAAIDGAGDDGTEHARGDVVGMTFDARGFVQNARRLPIQAQQMVGDDDARGEGGRAGAESFADGDVVVDFERDGGQSSGDVFGHRERSLPDQIIVAS